MQRMAATAMLALALCIPSEADRAVAPRPPSTFSLELRAANPALRSGDDLVLTLKIRTFETTRVFIENRCLAQYLHFWREAAMDILFKKLHMA